MVAELGAESGGGQGFFRGKNMRKKQDFGWDLVGKKENHEEKQDFGWDFCGETVGKNCL